MVSGAYEEFLEEGALGPFGAEALYRTVAAVARFDHYPPPKHHHSWSEEAVSEVAHDFLAGERSTERLLHLAVLATDERSFARLLEAAVRNFFRSNARATERGRLRRRLQTLLDEGPEFEQVPTGQEAAGSWTLRGGNFLPWNGRIDDLINAASTVPLAITRWRDGAGADRSSLRELSVRILTSAEGAVTLSDLLGTISFRLGLGLPPLTTEVDAADVASTVDVPSQAQATLAARDVFDQLTPRERLLVLVLDEPVREAAAFVGISKTTAADALNRLKAKLASLLATDNDELSVLRELEQMAAKWAEERTDEGDAAS